MYALVTVYALENRGSPVASNPLMTHAWRPRQTRSPTGLRYSRIAVAAIFIASWRLSAPTTRYAPARWTTRPAAQPRIDAPWRVRPLGVGPLHARARSWRRRWVRDDRSAPGSMMLSIIWTLAP